MRMKARITQPHAHKIAHYSVYLYRTPEHITEALHAPCPWEKYGDFDSLSAARTQAGYLFETGDYPRIEIKKGAANQNIKMKTYKTVQVFERTESWPFGLMIAASVFTIGTLALGCALIWTMHLF